MAASPNLYLQTAGACREEFLEGVAQTFGPDRLLFLSTYPYMYPRLEVERPRSIQVSDEVNVGVLSANALAALGLDREEA